MQNLIPSRRSSHRFRVWILGFLACAAILVPTTTAGGPAGHRWISAADLRLQTDGWTIDSVTVQGAERPGSRHLVAAGRIAVPARDLWRIVARPDDQGDPWPSIKEVVVEHVSPDTVIARYALSVPVYPDRRYRLRSMPDAGQMRLDFEMIPGYGNVHEIRGYWRIIALSDSLSRVLYVLDTDPGAKLIPGFIISWATRRTIPHLFSFLREEALAHDGPTPQSGERVP